MKKKTIDKKIIEKEIREYDLADYIFVPSKFSKKTFIENGVNESKILKVPYGTDLNEFNRTDNDPKDFTIISVGQISVRKGSIYLLKAFEDLNLDNSKLILVGNIENDLKDHLEPFLSNPIIFKSHVKQSKLSDLYNNSHLFVTTSLEEGLAMVQPQAMACGLPIICTTNSGGAEIVDEGTNGFICPIRDVDYLKKKISFFYYNRDKLKNFSENSYKKAREYLSWDNYSQKVYEEYKKLI